MKPLTRLGLALCAALTLGASCGETNIQAIERLRPRGAETRERLRAVHGRLPPARKLARAFGPARPLSPPLVLDFQEPASTADALMFEQLAQPERDMSGELDLMLSPQLLNCLLWTGPKNPLDQSVWSDRTELGPDCERAFSVHWLVVPRTHLYELPEAVELEVFVVDLASGAVVAGLPLSLSGKYRRQDVGRGRWASEALRQLRSDAFVIARCEIARWLGELPGVTLRFRTEEVLGSGHPCQDVPRTFVVSRSLSSARAE